VKKVILKKVGNTKILCEKKDGTEKWFKASTAVIGFAKKAFKTGDSIKAEFNDQTYVIEKITKLGAEGSKEKGSYSAKGGNVDKMLEMSVLKSVAPIVSNIEDTKTLPKAKKALAELYEFGMELVNGKKEEKVEETEEVVDEPEENPEPDD
jgi:hypothetical protein